MVTQYFFKLDFAAQPRKHYPQLLGLPKDIGLEVLLCHIQTLMHCASVHEARCVKVSVAARVTLKVFVSFDDRLGRVLCFSHLTCNLVFD
jgi:hypothetical protein